MSRNFVLQDKPKAIINIVDATNIERNLYLTMQLLEMDVPMVLALNMMDEVTGNGGTNRCEPDGRNTGNPCHSDFGCKKSGCR